MLWIRIADDDVEVSGRVYQAGDVLQVKAGTAHRLVAECRAVLLNRPPAPALAHGQPGRETRVA